MNEGRKKLVLTFEKIVEIVGNCSFNYSENWLIEVKLDGQRPYLQIRAVQGTDSHTGEKVEWTGRKWFLSYHMVPNEIVRTAFKAVMTAMQHEVEEMFLYKGVAIYNPHLDPDKLVDFASNPDNIQERTDVIYGA